MSLELIIRDKILANQSFENIIEIGQFVKLAFSLREKFAETFLYAFTPSHINDTERPKQNDKIISSEVSCLY